MGGAILAEARRHGNLWPMNAGTRAPVIRSTSPLVIAADRVGLALAARTDTVDATR